MSPLKPGSIVGAAAADLVLARKKREGDANRFAPYSFHRDHVRASDDPIDLIALAMKEPELGAGSGKRCTREIYSNVDLLAAAFVRAAEGQAA